MLSLMLEYPPLKSNAAWTTFVKPPLIHPMRTSVPTGVRNDMQYEALLSGRCAEEFLAGSTYRRHPRLPLPLWIKTDSSRIAASTRWGSVPVLVSVRIQQRLDRLLDHIGLAIATARTSAHDKEK